MELKKVFIVLADISGYTKFINLHKISLLHAEKIVIDLLNAVIDSTSSPLVLHEVLGDAVTFYALAENESEAAKVIYDQVSGFSNSFRQKEGELVSDCKLCICSACQQIDSLKLKTIVNFGEAVFSDFRGVQKIAGSEIIAAHRLLKNSIKADEYILMTDSYSRLLPSEISNSLEARNEIYPELGKISFGVKYPDGFIPNIKSSSMISKLKKSIKMNWYSIRSVFKGKKIVYRNLPVKT